MGKKGLRVLMEDWQNKNDHFNILYISLHYLKENLNKQASL